MKSVFYISLLPVAFCNLYGYTGHDCTGQMVLVDNKVCNGCVVMPQQPRLVSYKGVDMQSFALTSRQACRNSGNLGIVNAGQCLNDPNALAASAYVFC